MNRLVAIGLIWLGCAVAWVILGSTILVRTDGISSSLRGEVHQLWGPPLEQAPPRAFFHDVKTVTDTVTTKDASGVEQQAERQRRVDTEVDISLDSTLVRASLALEQRRKGLLWFPTYQVDFRSRYGFVNDSGQVRDVELVFPLAGEDALYDGFGVTDGAGQPVPTSISGGLARWTARFDPGERRDYAVAYRSRGTSQWRYRLTQGMGRATNVNVELETDFTAVDFPPGTLSPSAHGSKGGRWHGAWQFSSLISSKPIGVDLPQLLNPGPLASRITFFAPVGLLFFFFVVAVFATAQRRDIHPLNFFFFGCAFFAFHLLFAYLVDHLEIAPSFGLASAVSILLVATYARLFVGWRFALVQMGLSQLIYLVLFSFTFFWEGFTGLAITIGAVLTLFVMMQLTGRVSWRAVTAPPQPA
ncbi:MAG: inner membrane CreD family protein [Deltaproteobacteria bacterium]|nr:inner membrane CreD family protein [Deltaproteobacteria bacterium]